MQDKNIDFEFCAICSLVKEHVFQCLIMPAYSPSLALRDYLKPYLRLLRAWHRKRFYALSRSLLQSRSTVLSQSGRTRLQHKQGGLTARLDKWVSTMSTFLTQLPWKDIEKRHFARLRRRQEGWSMVIHDGSDMNKRWAEKMEGLSTVRDASTGEMVNGYTFFLSIGFGKRSWDIHPIDCTLINPTDEDFTCKGDMLKAQLKKMLHYGVGIDYLHVFDREFDDEKWFTFLDQQELSWLIRLQENRKVWFRGEEHKLDSIRETLLEGGREQPDGTIINWATIDVPLPSLKKKRGKIPRRTYTLIVIKRPQFKKPMLFLISGSIRKVEEAMQWYLSYLDRWEVEDGIRFFKQALGIEVMQLMKHDKLQSLLYLQMLLMDFILREYDRGVRPIGAPLREVLQRSIKNDTRILSPYLLADHLGDTLKDDQRQCDPTLVPHVISQLSLFEAMDIF